MPLLIKSDSVKLYEKEKCIRKSTSSVCKCRFIQKAVEARVDRSRDKYGQKEFYPISAKVLKTNGDKNYRAINLTHNVPIII